MKKLIRTAAALAAMAVLGTPGRALAADGNHKVTKEMAKQEAEKLVPEDGALQYTEKHEDTYEVLYYSASQEEYYTVRVCADTGKVESLATALLNSQGSKEAVLSEEEIKQIVMEDAGEVTVDSIALDTEDGRKQYDVFCSRDNFQALYRVHPESGKILERVIVYL